MDSAPGQRPESRSDPAGLPEVETVAPCPSCDSRRWVLVSYPPQPVIPCYVCRRHKLVMIIRHMAREEQIRFRECLANHLDGVKQGARNRA